MSKIESPFHIDNKAEFRFALILESRSVEAHSLMDSKDNKEILLQELNHLAHTLINSDYVKFNIMINQWKEEHK